MIWVSKTIPQIISDKFVRADILDPNIKPELYRLIIQYQVHKYKTHICSRPRAKQNGKCKKGFPYNITEYTHHRRGDKRYTYK
jgi:hypothetical protein